MNVMIRANDSTRTRNSKKRNIIIAVVIVLLVTSLAIGAYFIFYQSQRKITAVNKKVESIQKQINAIPDLKSQENVNKYKKLTAELQAAQDEQWKILQDGLSPSAN